MAVEPEAEAILCHSNRFAAALAQQLGQQWVMNVVGARGPDTLPVIYERGLLGVYHDWCESLSTYPRSYDLLHVDHLLTLEQGRYEQMLPIFSLLLVVLSKGMSALWGGLCQVSLTCCLPEELLLEDL